MQSLYCRNVSLLLIGCSKSNLFWGVDSSGGACVSLSVHYFYGHFQEQLIVKRQGCRPAPGGLQKEKGGLPTSGGRGVTAPSGVSGGPLHNGWGWAD